jgi:hypothetical protein
LDSCHGNACTWGDNHAPRLARKKITRGKRRFFIMGKFIPREENKGKKKDNFSKKRNKKK